jgi:hypothetical protein
MVPGMEVINGFELIDFYCILLGKDVPSSPLNQVLELASQYMAIQDFFHFIFWVAYNNNRFWGGYDLA